MAHGAAEFWGGAMFGGPAPEQPEKIEYDAELLQSLVKSGTAVD